MRNYPLIVLKSLLVIAVFCLQSGNAQNQKSDLPKLGIINEKTQAQLRAIQRDLAWNESQLNEKKKLLSDPSTPNIAEIREEIGALEARLKRERLNFIETLSDIDLPSQEQSTKPKKRDLLQELQLLVEPLFDAVQRASEKPRRIEGYRNRIFIIGNQIESIDKALTALAQRLVDNSLPEFQSEIQLSQKALSQSRESLQVELNSLERSLNHELGDRRTVWQILSESVQDFFAAKGRNLLLSIFVFSFTYWLLLYLRKYVFRFFGQNPNLRPIIRPLQLGYGLLAGLVSIAVVIFTLHLLHDNFLVTVIVLLLIALAWSSKAVISHFITETKLALNLGPVKQGERVVWQGVPWLVQSLGFRSVLKNEALQGGTVTLPAASLTSMLSRTVVAGEPWFPTNVGDHVQLDDGKYGYIETQTPECVVVVVNQTRKFYSTNSFLSKNPQNFSRGFELEFGVFYRHESKLQPNEAWDNQLIATVKKILNEDLRFYKNLKIEHVASGSTLTKVWIKAECEGQDAARRTDLERQLRKAVGEAWYALARS